MAGRERLQKFLSRAGVAARRQAEILMAEGRVTVNGEIAMTPGITVDPLTDRVEVDGRRIRVPQSHTYLLLNKPEGVITSARDPQGRRTVLDLVPHQGRVFPVGRLDYDSAGLVLLTDDGDLANRLTHPRYGVEKTYLVEFEGELPRERLDMLRSGVRLTDGMTAPADVKVPKRARGGGILEMTLREGKNREVRRMCGAVGLKVTSLVRTRFGPLHIRGLRPGASRELTAEEVSLLNEAGR